MITTIEKGCLVHIVVKHTSFVRHIESFLLGTLLTSSCSYRISYLNTIATTYTRLIQ